MTCRRSHNGGRWFWRRRSGLLPLHPLSPDTSCLFATKRARKIAFVVYNRLCSKSNAHPSYSVKWSLDASSISLCISGHPLCCVCALQWCHFACVFTRRASNSFRSHAITFDLLPEASHYSCTSNPFICTHEIQIIYARKMH